LVFGKHAAAGRTARRRRTISMLAVGIAVALTGVVVPLHAPPAAADDATAEELAAQEMLLPVAASADTIAASDSAFSSDAINPTTGVLTVYRVGGTSGAVVSQHQALSLSNGAIVQVLGARLTQTQADALSQRIDADVDTLAAQGITVSSWGPDPNGGPFSIEVVDADLYRAALLARYADVGAGNLVLFSGPMVKTGSYSESVTHYRLLRTIEDMHGLPAIGNAASTTAISDVWS